MVDARKAVEMALHMGNSSDYGLIDWTKQAHLLNFTEYGDEILLKGHSWAIEGQVSRVEYRVDMGIGRKSTTKETIQRAALLSHSTGHSPLTRGKSGLKLET